MSGLVDVRERYRLLAKLGSGGMADVFLAIQLGAEDFRRLVVLKRIHSRWLGQPDSFKMFIDEAQLVASLNHPHIVKIFDLSWMGSDICIAMEYVDGENLGFTVNAMRDRNERMPLPVVFKIMVETCEALSYLHAATTPNGEPLNMVHRDICPQNLLLDSNGYIKLIDFGIAKSIDASSDATSPGMLKGKLPYLAPEMLQQVAVDGRADLYALGLVMFELLTLQQAVPFEKETAVAEIMRRISSDELPSVADIVPGLDPRLDVLLAKATHKESVHRFQTGAGFAAEIGRLAESMGGLASTAEVARWFQTSFPTRIAQRREFERLAVRKASEPPQLDGGDGSPALVTNRTANIGAFPEEGLGVTRSSQLSLEASPARVNPYLFAVVLFVLVTIGLVVFHQLFWSEEEPAPQSSVYLISDNLFVRTTPAGADVLVNGELAGNTGSAGLNFRVEPDREHLLVLRLEGHEPYSMTLRGESFGQRRIDAQLIPSPGAASAELATTTSKRPRRKRRAKPEGRERTKLRVEAPPAPADDDEGYEVSALEAADDGLAMTDLINRLSDLDEPEPEVPKSPSEPPVTPATPPPPLPPPAKPVPAKKTAPAPRVQPLEEPVVQSTAEVMGRRKSGKAPAYPRWALVDGAETTVEVRVIITPAGRIESIEHVAGDRAFRSSVERALRNWDFRPHVIGGRAVQTTAVLKFVFKLESS